jgi:hypothetical protein
MALEALALLLGPRERKGEPAPALSVSVSASIDQKQAE